MELDSEPYDCVIRLMKTLNTPDIRLTVVIIFPYAINVFVVGKYKIKLLSCERENNDTR